MWMFTLSGNVRINLGNTMNHDKKYWPIEDQVYEIANLIREFNWDADGFHNFQERIYQSMKQQQEVKEGKR
jgi:hypothetical protein